MKKRLLFLLLVCMLSLQPFAIHASGTAEDTSLRNQLVNKNSERVEEFLKPELFGPSMEGVNLKDQAAVFVFARPLWTCQNMTFAEFLEHSFANRVPEIVLLQDEPIGICYYGKNIENSKIGAYVYPVHPFMRDLLDGTVQQDFLGQRCLIQNVFCFGFRVSYEAMDVVYETDRGVFVRHYSDMEAAAVEYDWDTYAEIAQAYYAYVTAYENNYDKDGNPLGSQNRPFVEFEKEYMAQKEATRLAELEAARQRTIWIAVSVGAVVVLAAGAAILVYTHKRKHHPAQT